MANNLTLTFNVTTPQPDIAEAQEIANDVSHHAREFGFETGPDDVVQVAAHVFSVHIPIARTMDSRGVAFADYLDLLPMADAIRIR